MQFANVDSNLYLCGSDFALTGYKGKVDVPLQRYIAPRCVLMRECRRRYLRITATEGDQR